MADAQSFRAAPLAAIFGAGAASAILFSLIGKGTALAVTLAYLSPLPMMIAMIGFGPVAGLGAGAVACVGVAVVAMLQADAGDLGEAAASALTFAAALAAPSLWLAFFASRAFSAAPRAPDEQSGAALEKIMSAAIVCAAGVAVGATLLVALRLGGFEAALARADALLTPALESVVGEAQLPAGVDLGRVARVMALAAPPAIAASTLLMLLINLWLAARVAQKSAPPPQRWPDIPAGLRLPRVCAPLLAGALAVTLVGGPAGLIAATLAAALVMAFALQGLAAIHDLTRGLKQRPFILGLVYFALIALAPPWLLIPCAALGVVESLFGLRARKRTAAARRPR